jgi:hypothetical protein
MEVRKIFLNAQNVSEVGGLETPQPLWLRCPCKGSNKMFNISVSKPNPLSKRKLKVAALLKVWGFSFYSVY